MERSAHFSRGGQCGGAIEPGVQNSHNHWNVGVRVVMVVSKNKGCSRLQCRGVMTEYLRQTQGEVLQAAPHHLVACQLLQGPGRRRFESIEFIPQRKAQPYVTKIHEFRVLDIVKIWRIGKDPVE